MTEGTFDIVILTGRPASGKSEIIDFLTHLPADIRRGQFHIASLEVLDDFPILWAWFEEDDILTKLGLPPSFGGDPETGSDPVRARAV